MSSRASPIEDLLQNGDLQILIPQEQLTQEELESDDAARVLERILRDPQRSQAFHGQQDATCLSL